MHAKVLHKMVPIFLALFLSFSVICIVPPKGKPHLWLEGGIAYEYLHIYRDGDTLNAWCEVEGGRPEPVFEWYLNDRLITKEIKTQVSNADRTDVKYTQSLRLPMNWKQDGMFLYCSVSHIAWTKDKESAIKYLDVIYSPREMKEPIHLEGFVTGKSANISVDVQANPGPQFIWTVDDVIVQETMAVKQKLVVWPEQYVAYDTWRAILTVMNLNDADLNRNYSLRARNVEGQAIYNVKIFGTRTPTTVPPKGKPHLWLEGGSAYNNRHIYRDGDTLNAWCEVEGGRPEPVFKWYLNSRLITKGIKQQVSNADSPDVKYTQNLRLPVNWTQNRMYLYCNVSHMAWKKDKERTFTFLNVTYSPREIKGPIHLEGFVTGESANISVDVQANPRPEFTWTVDDVIVQKKMAVEQKLLVWPRKRVAKDTYRAVLTVTTLTDADLNRNYSLLARNAEGQAIYNVKIFGTRRTTTTDLDPIRVIVKEITPIETTVPATEVVDLDPTRVIVKKITAIETTVPDTEVVDLEPTQVIVAEISLIVTTIPDTKVVDLEPTRVIFAEITTIDTTVPDTEVIGLEPTQVIVVETTLSETTVPDTEVIDLEPTQVIVAEISPIVTTIPDTKVVDLEPTRVIIAEITTIDTTVPDTEVIDLDHTRVIVKEITPIETTVPDTEVVDLEPTRVIFAEITTIESTVPDTEVVDFEPTPGTATKMTPNDTDTLDGQWDKTLLVWAAFTGIVVIILLLLVVLVLLLAGYGRTTRRWCFAAISETNTHDDVVPGEQFELGQLGLMLKGKVCLPGEVAPREVLVKTVALTHTRTLASKLQVWSTLLPHVNVLRLLGTYTSNLNKEDLLVVVEFCRHGNLHDYLWRHRSDFIDQVDRSTDRIDARFGAVIFANFRNREKLKRSQNVCTNNTGPDHFYESIEQLFSRTATDSSEQQPLIGTRDRDREPPVCTGDLLSWVFQVAQGMDYLADRKIVHGNLAARHVFLADDNIVKISDSSLSRSVSETSEFLPLKWMAVESLKDRTVSLESDVWSYGIFMWEVFSLAQTPYPDIESPDKLHEMLLRGYRLEKPQFGIQAIHDVMKLCWQLKPEDRPPFHEVISLVGRVFENNFEDMYMNVSHLYDVVTNPTESESHHYYEVPRQDASATQDTASKMEDEKLDRASCQYYEIGSGAVNMNDSDVHNKNNTGSSRLSNPAQQETTEL